MHPTYAAADRYYSTYDIGLDAAWELDVWGKFRRAVQTGVASLEASIADYDDILVSLTSEVARTFIVLRTSEERLEVARVKTCQDPEKITGNSRCQVQSRRGNRTRCHPGQIAFEKYRVDDSRF